MEKVFGIIPATSGVYTFLWIVGIVVGVICIGAIGLFISYGYQAKHLAFTVNDQGLRIGPGLYGRFIPKEEIDTAGVKVVNLQVESEYKPKWRTNGASMPGYAAGWFRLANKEKALVFVTDRSSVVYIPTTANYSVMLSVREADELVKLIQRWD